MRILARDQGGRPPASIGLIAIGNTDGQGYDEERLWHVLVQTDSVTMGTPRPSRLFFARRHLPGRPKAPPACDDLGRVAVHDGEE
jgi:hypothetical protein